MIHFCTQCGAEVAYAVPKGDNRHRHICTVCSHIHYENPRLVVGCIATWEDRILICKRAIEPRLGFWTLPAGFMENSETTAQAAMRETYEEAGAEVIIDAPFAMISIADINQVHMFYRGRLANATYSAGEESLEVALVEASNIPWHDLAFRSVKLCMQHFLDDRQRGTFGFHEAELPPLLF